MPLLKNYVSIFAITWLIVLLTKFVFVLYLQDSFTSYSIVRLLLSTLQGYRFDFAVSGLVAFIATCFDFNQRGLKIASITLILYIFCLQIADIMYFNDAQRHIGYEFTDVINDAGGLIGTAFSQHFKLLALSLVLITALFWLLKKRLHVFQITFNWAYLPKKLLLLALSVFFIRGMFDHIPLDPWQSNQIGDAKLADVALNGSYNALYALAQHNKNIGALPLPKISQENINTAFKQLYTPPAPFTIKATKPNIVFIFLESWPANKMQPYGFTQQITPKFDALLTKSIRTKGMIANGHRTTEGLFATLASYQNPLGRSIAKTNLQFLKYHTVIDILNTQGYSSAMFQGTAKETSGTGSLAQSLGFKQSYGKEDIKQRQYENNDWGVYDQDLYRYVMEKTQTLKQPFVLGINTSTTHDDKTPAAIKPKHFAENESLNKKLNTLNFADLALGDFVTVMEKTYPNTLFVMFSDHTAGVTESTFENYLIPFAIYGNTITPQYIDQFVSQRDIAPSVLDVIGLDYTSVAPHFTGQSIFRHHTFFADFYNTGRLGWVYNNQYIEYTTTTQHINCFNITTYKPIAEPCTSHASSLANQALAFATISQKQLFAGQTIDFNKRQ